MYTGFEKVMRQTMTQLAEQNGGDDYDITVMGLGYRGQPLIRYPFEVVQASADPQDMLGAKTLDAMAERYKADVVWILHDLWQVTTYAAFQKSDVPLVSYSPVDTPNMKWYFTLALGRIAQAAVYTQFGAREIAAGVQDAIDTMAVAARAQPGAFALPKRRAAIPHPMGTQLIIEFAKLMRYQNPEAFRVIPHGLEHQAFGQLNKRECRARFGIPDDAFVVGHVNANQFRKLQDRVIRAFARLAAYAPDAVLVMHCAGHTIQGYDLEQIARYYGVEKRVFRVHEHKYELTDEELLALYNTFDVQINLSGGEGWGLTSMEGAACGVPQILTDWGPAEEIWGDSAVRVPASDYRMEPKFLNTCHAIPDLQVAGDVLIDLWEHRDKLQDLSTMALERAAAQWSWAQVAEATGAMLQDAVAMPPSPAVSMEDMLSVRTADVASALANTPILHPRPVPEPLPT